MRVGFEWSHWRMNFLEEGLEMTLLYLFRYTSFYNSYNGVPWLTVRGVYIQHPVSSQEVYSAPHNAVNDFWRLDIDRQRDLVRHLYIVYNFWRGQIIRHGWNDQIGYIKPKEKKYHSSPFWWECNLIGILLRDDVFISDISVYIHVYILEEKKGNEKFYFKGGK